MLFVPIATLTSLVTTLARRPGTHHCAVNVTSQSAGIAHGVEIGAEVYIVRSGPVSRPSAKNRRIFGYIFDAISRARGCYLRGKVEESDLAQAVSPIGAIVGMSGQDDVLCILAAKICLV